MIAGTIDLEAYGALKRFLAELIARGPSAPHHAIDMSRVDFIDSMGVSALIHHAQGVQVAGGTLKLLCSAQVFRVIRAVGLTDVLNATEGTDFPPFDPATTN